MGKKKQSDSEPEHKGCQHVYKQGKRKGCYCTVTKIFKDGYCKQHYEREFPQQALKKPKITEIDSNGEEVEYSDFEPAEPIPDNVDVIEVKVSREVYLDIDFLLTALKKQQAADAKPAKAKKTKKIVKAKKPAPKKKRRQAESVSGDSNVNSEEDIESSEESMISESAASEDQRMIPLNRDKTLYVDALRHVANKGLVPGIEMALSVHTPLKVQGLSRAFASSNEVQSALEEVILEQVPDAIEECSPTMKLLLAISALCAGLHFNNTQAEKEAEAERIARQQVNPLLEEKYSEL